MTIEHVRTNNPPSKLETAATIVIKPSNVQAACTGENPGVDISGILVPILKYFFQPPMHVTVGMPTKLCAQQPYLSRKGPLTKGL